MYGASEWEGQHLAVFGRDAFPRDSAGEAEGREAVGFERDGRVFSRAAVTVAPSLVYCQALVPAAAESFSESREEEQEEEEAGADGEFEAAADNGDRNGDGDAERASEATPTPSPGPAAAPEPAGAAILYRPGPPPEDRGEKDATMVAGASASAVDPWRADIGASAADAGGLGQ